MATSKYKVNDRIKVISNSLQPQYEGASGKVKKVYATFSESDTTERDYFYRVEIDGIVLKGIARESDLAAI